MSVNEEEDIVVCLNCILVNEDIRPAMLVQHANYGEYTHNDPKTKSILERIKEYFPDLVVSTDYAINQGAIISKTTNYNGNRNISVTEMGRILGYPCFQDYVNIDEDEISYAISIIVKNTNGGEITLLANACKDLAKIEYFNILASKAQIAFGKEEYKKFLNGFQVQSVYVASKTIVPIKIIINKLLDNEELDENEKDIAINDATNFGFGDDLFDYFINKFQYDNPIHKGILISLLLNLKYFILKPFNPNEKELRQYSKIVEEWGEELLYVLKKTEIKSREKLKIEGGKRTKKIKRRSKLLSNRKKSSSKNK